MNICGICKRPPRVGDDTKKIRISEEDMKDKKYPEPKVPGLYQCCVECFDEYAPVVEARLGHAPGTMPHNGCV